MSVNTQFNEPFRSPRPSVFAECVFLERWQSLVCKAPQGDLPHMINSLLSDAFPGDTTFLRDESRLLASWFMWLGTNVGTCYRDAADRVFASRSDRYFLGWALENRRVNGMNGNCRAIEHLVLDDAGKPAKAVTARDLEIIDVAALWLGGKDGTAWLKHTCDEIETIRAAVRGIAILHPHLRKYAMTAITSKETDNV